MRPVSRSVAGSGSLENVPLPSACGRESAIKRFNLTRTSRNTLEVVGAQVGRNTLAKPQEIDRGTDMCAGLVYEDGKGFTTPDYEMPLPDAAKLEINVNSGGVSFVGNSAGYRALAETFERLADMAEGAPEDETCGSPKHWHLEDFVPLQANLDHRLLLGFGPLLANATRFGEAAGTGVIFYASGQVGQAFWEGHVTSGDSPRLALDRETSRYRWLDEATEQDVLARVGIPDVVEKTSATDSLQRFIVAVHEPVLIGAGTSPWELSVWMESGQVVSWNLWPQDDDSWRPAPVG
jgi:hypothetical protein